MRLIETTGPTRRFGGCLWIAALFLLCVSPIHDAFCADVEVEDQHRALVTKVYVDVLMRIPTPAELEKWSKVVAESGTTEERLYDIARASDEYKKLVVRRKWEVQRILLWSCVFVVLCGAVYLLAVRKRPERRLLFVAFIFLAAPTFLHHDYVHREAHFDDLPSFFYAANYVYNQDRSPYGNGIIDDVERRVHPFFHPPPCMLIFYPLSRITYEAAKDYVTIGNQIALILLLYFMILHNRRDDPPLVPLCLLVYIMSFHPGTLTFAYGQTNFWTTLFICLVMEAVVRGRSNAWLGLTMAGAIVCKIYPGLLVLYLVLKRKWGAIAWCIAGLAVCTGVGLVTIRWEIWESWWAGVGSRAAYGEEGPVGLFSPAGPWNQGINGICQRLFTDNEFSVAIYHNPVLAKGMAYLLSAIMLGGAMALLWKRNAKGLTDEPELEMGLVLAVMSVIVPLSWAHHSVLLLPAIVVGARRMLKQPRTLTAVIFCASAFGLAWDWSMLPEDLRLFKGGYSMLLGSVVGFARIGLAISLFMMLREPLRKGEGGTAPSRSLSP